LIKVWQEVGPCLAFPKPDGWRIQVHKAGGIVKLFSRSDKDWTAEFHSVAQIISERFADDRVILDTELIGFDGRGCHLAPAKLRSAAQYRCYIFDALYLGGKDLTLLPARERVANIQDYLTDVCRGLFVLAEYNYLVSPEGLQEFYQRCLARRKEGFDGVIIKKLDTPYFSDALKIKPEDSVDAVVVGAYLDKRQVEMSLLLAVPDRQRKQWVPIGKVTKQSTDWDIVWPVCQPFVLDHRPDNIDDPPVDPDIWIAPAVVVAVTIRWVSESTSYVSGVTCEAIRQCTLREDKGVEDATSFEQILQMAGLPRKQQQQQQLPLF
jgi:DNA ligase-1